MEKIVRKHEKEQKMARNQTVRIRPSTLKRDLVAHAALQAFTDYVPADPTYNQKAAQSLLEAMKNAQDAELNARNALDAARDTAAATEWEFHNFMLGVKDQVVARFGSDSNQVQALGLKKKSERKAPGRKPKAKQI
jgi:hypothetical protein